MLERIEVPIQFHSGGNDPYIPREEVARVETAASDRDNAEIHVEDAGHPFHSRKAPMFYHPEAAGLACRRAEEFLAMHLPVRGGS